jgi:hypothetical protein
VNVTKPAQITQIQHKWSTNTQKQNTKQTKQKQVNNDDDDADDNNNNNNNTEMQCEWNVKTRVIPIIQ